MTFIFSVFSFPAPQLMQSISDKPKKRFLGTILYDDAFLFSGSGSFLIAGLEVAPGRGR